MKTAMQELIEWLNGEIYTEQDPLTQMKITAYRMKAQLLLEKEKEQIIDAYYGKINGVFGYREEGEQYYNQTYNQ